MTKLNPRGPIVTALEADRSGRVLRVSFNDGRAYLLPFEYLRVHSPSAEVQGHGNPKLVAHKKEVGISAIEAVGNYAVKIIFDDGHDSGIYTWQWLYILGRDHDKLWADYLSSLRASRLSREPLLDFKLL